MLKVRFREALRVGIGAWAPSAGLSWFSASAPATTFKLSAFLLVLAPRLLLLESVRPLAASALLAGEEAGAGSARPSSLSPGPPTPPASPATSAEQLARHFKRDALGKVARNQTCTSADQVCGVSCDAQGPGCPVQGLRRWAGSSGWQHRRQKCAETEAQQSKPTHLEASSPAGH